MRSTDTVRTKQGHGGKAFDPSRRKLQASKWPKSGAQGGPKSWQGWKLRLWKGSALMQSAAPTTVIVAGLACSPRGIGRSSTGSPVQISSKSQPRSRLQYVQLLRPARFTLRKQQAGCRGASFVKEACTADGHHASTTLPKQLTPSQERCAHLHPKTARRRSHISTFHHSALQVHSPDVQTQPCRRLRMQDSIDAQSNS